MARYLFYNLNKADKKSKKIKPKFLIWFVNKEKV